MCERPQKQMPIRRRWSPVALAMLAAVIIAACGGGADKGPGRAERPSVDVRLAQQAVDRNLAANASYSGPLTGPVAKHGQLVVFVAADITNGGIAGVARGVEQATRAIGWRLRIIDGRASVAGRGQAMRAALALKPDGIILGGFDASEQRATLVRAKQERIPVVGWHAYIRPGPDPNDDLFANVSTEPRAVATLAADYVIARSHGHAGVAIFYDPGFEIAIEKADVMQAALTKCSGCRVLAIEKVPISQAQALMPALVAKLVRRYGSRLTDLLAVNGNYFAGSAAGLFALGIGGAAPPYAVAAGDGDASEFARIRGRRYQAASVAEPLYLQGWQLIDDLNRAFSHDPPSTYTPPPRLITAADAPAGGVFNPRAAYRRDYLRIWGA